MAGSDEVNANESKRVVPLNTWILISNFKLAYNMLRRPDGTFNRDLNEFLDRKVPANANPVAGIYSFDVIIDRSTGLLNRERTESEKRLDGKYFVKIQDRDWYWRAYLPEGEDRDHPACNVFGPRARPIKSFGFPKSLVVVAELDLLQDWQLGYVDGLRKNGVEVRLLFLEKATIGFYFLPNNEHFCCLMDELNEFLHS
ncbi:Gibberellin receptor GID1B [Striga hermonthica]|uniref:Gibberellin receptor GID1B n=1 Tax=Striga hermonthica TaxID=68872 RepID=A0A9N7NCZ7_STRHE|nr:Gibberellin receptor GID1B [Striga hermonthica]